jgi:hypothetical protein
LTRLAKALDLTLPQLLEAAQEEQVRLRQHGDPQA